MLLDAADLYEITRMTVSTALSGLDLIQSLSEPRCQVLFLEWCSTIVTPDGHP